MRRSPLSLAFHLSLALAAVIRQRDGNSECQGLVNGQLTDFPWLCQLPADQRSQVNIPGVIQNGQFVSPASGGATSSTSSQTAPDPPPSTSQSTPSSTTIAVVPPATSSAAPAAIPTSSTSSSNNTGGGDTSASGCPAGLKSVTFNGGYNVGMFDTIGAAESWLSFGLDISGTPSSKASAAHVPMMAFASDVAAAVDLVNGDNAPDWLLTFNEPDYSYGGFTPTMSPQDAATAIQPLLKSPGTRTKFVAPVTADPLSDWVPQFFQACNCQSFFSAYNIHIYMPTSAATIAQLQKFRAGYAADKPVWLTEVAPGNADPACSVSWTAATTYMNDVYAFAKQSAWLTKVFWNTGNQIGPDDHNVCNSYLLDSAGSPSPLLKAYQAVDCSG